MKKALKSFGRKRWLRQHIFGSAMLPVTTLRSVMPVNYVAHDHDFIEIALIAEGHGLHKTVHGTCEVSRGDVAILRPGAWHAYKNCSRMIIFNTCLGAELLQKELAWLSDNPVLNCLFWTGPMAPDQRGILTLRIPDRSFTACARRWSELNRICRTRAAGELPRIAGLLQFLHELARGTEAGIRARFPTQPQAHFSVRNAMQVMERNLARQWTLRALAELTHIHPAYLVRLFKAHTGLPPMSYLARCRAERAASLLSGTNKAIKEIGQEVGWPDPNYFARRFRACHGLTASEYRTHLSGQHS